MKMIFNDPQYSFELLRAVSCSPYSGADIGECLATAYKIREGNDESWYEEWSKTAKRIESIGEKCLANHHEISAREAFLRASNYYRTAEFFLHKDPSDPRIIKTWKKSADMFAKAAKLFHPPFQHIDIPYENTTIPGYFFKPDSSNKPRPTIILHTGFDGTLEELYFQGAAAAIRRKFNCLAIEGPGQGGVLRQQKIYFRHDWEKVISPAVNYLITRPDVDREKIAILGWSFGGYLAPRAAAFEKRISLCIANGGLFDFLEALAKTAGMSKNELLSYCRKNAEEFNKTVYEQMKRNSMTRWSIQDGLWKFNCKTPSEWFLSLAKYNLEDSVDKIRCHTIVVDTEGEQFFMGQAEKLFMSLDCLKEMMVFSREDCAEEHCQAGAPLISHQRMFDRIQEIFS